MDKERVAFRIPNATTDELVLELGKLSRKEIMRLQIIGRHETLTLSAVSADKVNLVAFYP